MKETQLTRYGIYHILWSVSFFRASKLELWVWLVGLHSTLPIRVTYMTPGLPSSPTTEIYRIDIRFHRTSASDLQTNLLKEQD